MNYDFSTLNDKDFEILSRDILNAHLKLDLQNFKSGKDKGIDLRFSSIENNNSIVVQAKHYLKSGFTKLIYDLKNKELSKVNILKPERYILVTSIGLSNQEKDLIKETFEPYILKSNDIFGKEDLNKYLIEFKEIEKNHFKLWFSSTSILSSILNNAIEARTKSYLQRIKNKIPLYVLTKNLDEANKILEKQKILLISGQPGIGKTTLADVLLFEKAKLNFEVYLVRDIKEAEDVISIDDNKRQVFYFDDFLGEVYYEIISGSNNENQIADFLDRIKHTPNKYLILATRTVILEQAKEKSEKIKRSRLDAVKYELKLNDYNKYEKAKILYNHLYFKNIEPEFIEYIVEDKFYYNIIIHKNYSPRIIEFITDNYKNHGNSKEDFISFIIESLNNPSEIWSYSFKNQINYFDRCLLLSMFTIQKTIDDKLLNAIYQKRLEYERDVNNHKIENNQFNLSLKNLLEGFISASIVDVEKNIKNYKFINPSLSDFFISYLNNNINEKTAVISSIKFFEQLDIFNPEKEKLSLDISLQKIISDKVKNNELDSLDSYKEYKLVGLNILTLVKYCRDIEIDKTLLILLKQIDFKKIWWIRHNIFYVLNSLKNERLSIEFIKENFIDIIENLLEDLDEKDLILQLPTLFYKFNHDYSNFIKNEKGFNLIFNQVSKIVVKEENQLFSSYKDIIFDKEDSQNHIYYPLEDIKSTLNKILLPNIIIDVEEEITEEIYIKLIENNIKKEEESEKKIKDLENYYKDYEYRQEIENKRIDELFENLSD